MGDNTGCDKGAQGGKEAESGKPTLTNKEAESGKPTPTSKEAESGRPAQGSDEVVPGESSERFGSASREEEEGSESGQATPGHPGQH